MTDAWDNLNISLSARRSDRSSERYFFYANCAERFADLPGFIPSARVVKEANAFNAFLVAVGAVSGGRLRALVI